MLTGYRTILGMGLALIVALYQTFVGPLPAVDQSLWNIAVPIVAIALRFLTKSPVGHKPTP